MEEEKFNKIVSIANSLFESIKKGDVNFTEEYLKEQYKDDLWAFQYPESIMLSSQVELIAGNDSFEKILDIGCESKVFLKEKYQSNRFFDYMRWVTRKKLASYVRNSVEHKVKGIVYDSQLPFFWRKFINNEILVDIQAMVIKTIQHIYNYETRSANYRSMVR